MVDSIIFTVIGLSMLCLACWWMGYKTCASRSKREYDKGYEQAQKDRDYEEMLRTSQAKDEMLEQIYKEDQAREMIRQVGELFEDNNEGVDCGTY